MQAAIILLIAVLVIALVPLNSFGGDAEGTDITEDVTISNVSVKANIVVTKPTWNKDWRTFVENGKYVGDFEDYVVTAGETLRVYFNWSISEDKMVGIEAGDYFQFPIDPNALVLQKAPEAEIFAEKDGKKIEVGKLTTNLKNNTLIVTLNEEGAQAAELEEGYVLGVVSAASNVDGEVQTELAGMTFTFNTQPKTPTTTVEGGTIWKKSKPKTLLKTGWKRESDKYAQFTLEVNGDALYNKLLDSSYDPGVKQNVIVKDLLPTNLKFRDKDPVNMYVPYNYMYGDTEHKKAVTEPTVAAECFASVSIMNKFTRVDTTGMDILEFENYIKGTPYTYGIYDNSYFLANMGDMPSENLSIPVSQEFLDKKIKASSKYTESRRINTLTAYENAFGDKESAPALAVKITLNTNYTGFGGDDDKATNTAEMFWNNTQEATSTNNQEFNQYTGGVKLGQRYSVTINKTDGESREKLNGVSFRLEKYNENTDKFEQYKSLYEDEIKTTSDGAVVFTGLSKGIYQIIEEKGLDGYKKDVVFKDAGGEIADGTFEITGEEGGTVFVNVENFKEEVVNEDEVAGEEATPAAVAGNITGENEGNVLGQEETPAKDDSKVLGDEAKTSDAMKTAYALIVLALVAAFVLIISLKLRRRED